MSIPRDLAGTPFPAGKIHRTLDGPPVGTTTTLPPWLTALAGTATFPAAPDVWGVKMTTGTGAGSQATLATSFALDSTLFRQIRWTVDGLWIDSSATGATVSVGIHNAAATAGVVLFGLASSGTCVARTLTPGADVDTDLAYSWSGTEASRSRCITLDLRPIDRALYLMVGDQVIQGGAIDMAEDFVDGLLVPQVSIMNSTGGTGRWWRAAQVRLDLVHN